MKFDPTKDNLLSLRDEDAHKDLRAKMAAGVSFVLRMRQHVLQILA